MDSRLQSRIGHVREALWRKRGGGASVMVGSGFSRNADIRTLEGGLTPRWSDITNAMNAKMNRSTGSTDGCPADCSDPDPLITAQRYCDEFGRAELHRFLREQIGDDDVEPGELHHRLLALPWVDIFTTNWDTLLERTLERTVSPTYEIVRAADELPLASRPRVVKLHGSLPAHFPLVVTSTDYEEYPTKFAPFVNTARQALMESVFLLIGFSGDDPNFRTWVSWVRKELDLSAPKIYLAGWLELDKNSTKELEEIGVAPIDLALHPNREQWQHQKMEHMLATEWLIATLELGRPYPLEEWPKALNPPRSTIHALLEPVDRSNWRAPYIPPKLQSDEIEPDQEEMDSVVAAWRHNRSLYPGWLTFPEQLRGELRNLGNSKIAGDLLDSSKEDRIVEALMQFAPIERLQAVYEIVWRREIRLEPLGVELCCVARNTLEEVLSLRETSEKVDINGRIAIGVALALVTSARLKFDQVDFEAAVAVAIKLAQNYKNALHRLKYEKCLWALYQSDTGLLKSELDGWSVDRGDPYWAVRKSSLLLESGIREKAQALLQSAITSLRRSKKHFQDIAILSREAWATYLAQWYEKRPWSNVDGSAPHRARARDLVRFNCDPPSEIRSLTAAIQWLGTPQKGPGFELGEGPRPQRLIEFEQVDQRDHNYKALAAFRIIRLAEVVGMPRHSDPWPDFQPMLRHACEELHRDGQFELSLCLLLRISSGSSDELIRLLLSRPNLAKLPQSIVDSMGDLCERFIDDFAEGSQSHIERSNNHLANRATVAVEMLARLALRFGSYRSMKAFRMGLAIYGNPLFYDNILFREPIRDLLRWSWEAVPHDVKSELTLELLKSPIVGVDGYTPNEYAFFEPGSLIDGDDDAIPERSLQNEQLWSSTVTFLVRALSCGDEARWRAMVRIVQIALAGRLTKEEATTLAAAIWTPTTERDEVPVGHQVIKNWVYLLLPELRDGIAEEWFRAKWLSDEILSDESGELLDEGLYQIGDALAHSRIENFSLELSDTDCVLVQDILESWANTSPSQIGIAAFEQDRIEGMNGGIRGAAQMMLHVQLPNNIAENIYQKHKQFNERKIPSMLILVGLLKSPAVPKGEIHTALRKRFSSANLHDVSDAAIAMQFWLFASKHFDIPQPPTDLIREVGVIIATRRGGALSEALSVAKWIFLHGRQDDQTEISKLTLEGLAYLIVELDYEHQITKDTDVPLLRWKCVSLARAMKESGVDDESVDQWLEAAGTDPLPEVRYSVSSIRV